MRVAERDEQLVQQSDRKSSAQARQVRGSLDSRRLREIVEEPEEWLRTSRQLRHAAQVLWDAAAALIHARSGSLPISEIERRSSYLPVFALVAGFALENALKGVLAAAQSVGVEVSMKCIGNRQSEAATRLFIAGIDSRASHDLRKLAKRAGLTLDPDEERILRDFSSAVSWGARYPAPMREADLETFRTTNEQLKSSDLDRIDELLRRCYDLAAALSEKQGAVSAPSPPSSDPDEEL